MDKVHKGKCSVCKGEKEVLTISNGRLEGDICEKCAKKLNTSPDAFLAKHGKAMEKKGFLDSIMSVFSKKPKPEEGKKQDAEPPAKPEAKPKPRPKGKTSGDSMQTAIDRFLSLVKEEKKIGLLRAARVLEAKTATVEKWAIILDRRGLIELVYPRNPLQSPYVTVRKEGGGK